MKSRVLAALAAALALAASPLACRSRTSPPPNVIVVVVDTLRADRTSLLGYARPTTPAIESFATGAVTFEDAWSQGSWTAPSHAALFSGEEPHRLDLHRGLDTNLTGGETLAESLRDAGWRTAAFSANPWISKETGLMRGFDVAETYDLDHAAESSAANVLGRASEWILEQPAGATPFFVFANVMEPHAPYNPPDAPSRTFVREGYAPDTLAKARKMNGPGGLTESSLRRIPLPANLTAAISDLYDAETATADAAIGAFFGRLAASGLLDRTIVVVMSDHGEGLGDHGWREHGLRLHRELLRVPLVVRLPGRFEGGVRRRDVVRLTDVHATILDVCGLAPRSPGSTSPARPLDAAGPARVAFATDRPYAGWPTLAALPQTPEAKRELETVRRSIFDGRHHLIVDDRGGAELYDVRDDPAEAKDLSSHDADTLARLRAILDAEFTRR